MLTHLLKFFVMLLFYCILNIRAMFIKYNPPTEWRKYFYYLIGVLNTTYFKLGLSRLFMEFKSDLLGARSYLA